MELLWRCQENNFSWCPFRELDLRKEKVGVKDSLSQYGLMSIYQKFHLKEIRKL